MNRKYSWIIDKYTDSDRIFVFPSEIAAYEWAGFVLRNGGANAVDRERFISWDTFKEQCFQLFQNEKPVNRTIRSLFAAHLLENNRKKGFLKCFIPPEHSDLSLNFRKTAESVLMSLNSREMLLDSGLAAELKADLSLIFSEYSAFLDKHGLFEPAGIRPEIETAGRKYLITAPDIISDFNEYSTLLEKQENIEFYFFPEPDVNVSLTEFDTSSREYRWMAEEFEKLLDNNPYASAALTCISEQEQNYLLREFRTRGIPFTVRGGRELSLSPGARIFRHLGRLLSSQPEIGMLWTVFADNAVPWKESGMLKRMLDHLAESNYVLNSGKSRGDELKSVLAGSKKKEYSVWYRKLTESLKRIRQSSSFDSLAESVQTFVFRFADISAFSERSLAEYQLCMADLAKLSKLKEQVQELDIPDLYSIFLDQLEQHIYVPRQKQKGVQVFPYRVAAGIPADLYILSGCTQSGIRVSQRPFPFLRDDQRRMLNVEDADFSEAFLKAYLSCSAECTFARESNSGTALPPGFFIRRNALKKPDKEKNIYRMEKDLWAGSADASFQPYPALVTGLENFSIMNSPTGKKDYSAGDTVPGDIMSSLPVDINGEISVSASSLDSFLSCPYFYLNDRLFGLEEAKTEPEFINHLLIGTIEHKVLERFFRFIMENGGRLSLISEEEQRRVLEDIFRKTAFERFPRPWFETAYLADMDNAAKAVLSWLENERLQFADAVPEALELELEYTDCSTEIRYKGKIDRVSSDENALFIVDYKKGNPVSTAAVSRMETGSGAIQIPFYLFLMRKNGRTPERAYYYSFRKNRYIPVFGEGRNAIDEDKMNAVISRLESVAAEAVGSIRRGSFPANAERCSECSFQGLCRKKFFLN